MRVPPLRDFRALPRRSVQATVNGRILQVGDPRLLEQQAVKMPEQLAQQTTLHRTEQGKLRKMVQNLAWAVGYNLIALQLYASR
jgi:cation transport ATPase